MSNILRYEKSTAALDETLQALKAGDGGGTYDGMEPRVARLEDDMKEVKSDLKSIRSDLAEIKGRLSAMPTTLQLIAFAVAIFVAAGLFRAFVPIAG